MRLVKALFGETCRRPWQDFHFGLAINTYHALVSKGNILDLECPQFDNSSSSGQSATSATGELSLPVGLSLLTVLSRDRGGRTRKGTEKEGRDR
jgi:hypothetical protein